MVAGSFFVDKWHSKFNLTHVKNNSDWMGETLAVEGGAGSRSADGRGRTAVRNSTCGGVLIAREP